MPTEHERLLESDQMFRQLAANIEGYIWIVAVDGSHMYYISPSYERITGKSCAALYANPKSWFDIVHADDRERVWAVATASIESTRVAEYRITRPDGEIRWIRDRGFPIRDDSGAIHRLAGVGEDITTLKMANVQIAKARDFYLTLLDRFPLPIWRSRTDGKCDYFNQTWLQFTGRTHDQEFGDGWAQGVHADDLAQCLEQYLAALRDRVAFQLTYRLRRHDGEYRWIVDHGTPFFDLEGKFAGYIGACFDVTDQKKSMRDLQESKSQVQTLTHRLLALHEEESARLASELHDGISQTLTGLAISFEAGVKTGPELRDQHIADTRHWLETCLHQTRVMANQLCPAELDELGLLSSVLGLIENVQEQHLICIHFRHEGLHGRLDSKVESVVYRLVKEGLNNIVKHANARQASVRIWMQDGALHVQIEDEGAGFDTNMALASPRSAGLASVRELIELLGGTLLIESAMGDGTTLLARLPLIDRS